MTTDPTLKDRYGAVKDRVAEAAVRSGRRPNQVIIVAVTKFAEPDQIRQLVQLGHIDFGENRVQHLIQRATIIEEWLSRHRTMPSAPWPKAVNEDDGDFLAGPSDQPPKCPDAVRWHMIGHLQRNKARKVIDLCRLIHSVDSLRIAEELQAVAEKRDRTVDVLLQVNASREASKFGCAVPATIHLAEQIDTMVQVRLRGIMTIAAEAEDPEAARPTFRRTRELFEEIRDAGIAAPHFNILSMGMSNDFEVAIEEGANLVRIGSAIFGHTAAHEPAESAESAAD